MIRHLEDGRPACGFAGMGGVPALADALGRLGIERLSKDRTPEGRAPRPKRRAP